MGKFLSVFLAALQFSCGLYIFRQPSVEGNGPLFSCLIVVFAISMLLLEAPLYPRSLRKLWPCANCVVQYLLAAFIIERFMADFWFPLEVALSGVLPWLAVLIHYLFECVGLGDSKICNGIIGVLVSGSMGLFWNYLISLFMLFVVLHATKKIDLSMLEYGVGCFLSSITASFLTKLKALQQLLCRCDLGQSQRDRLASIRKPCSRPVEDTSDDFDENWYSRQYIK